MESRAFGVLCTISKRSPGFPFGSIVNYALDEEGRPIFVLSGLAVHTKNIADDAKASLCVFGPDAETDVLGAARMDLMGTVAIVPADELETARHLYFARHPDAEQYMEFADFNVYRMEVLDVYFVGGFGMMGWVTPSDYASSPKSS